MPTVRSFGAEQAELKEFQKCMDVYLDLNQRSSIAYFGYGTTIATLPQLVTALVLFYGGILVQSDGDDHISGGELVSFILYLSSLSDAFNSIGNIFSSITQAVGAGDKVFELINRKPRVRRPLTNNEMQLMSTKQKSYKCQRLHAIGLNPDKCIGEVTFSNVEMFYPARPRRRVLDFINFRVPPGAVVALVGPSGSGKSSIISLIQKLYDSSNGNVCIDDNEVSYSLFLYHQHFHKSLIFFLYFLVDPYFEFRMADS